MKKTLKRRPKLRQCLFWDVDPNKIDLKKHARYVIERVLDFGNDEEVRWMWHTYSRPQIREVVEKSRVLHEESRSLWRLLTSQKY